MKRIGLIAGNGKFPLLFAQEAKRRQEEVIAVALIGEADPSLEKLVDKFYWVHIGELGKLINKFKEENINRAVMAGQVKHRNLFSNLKFDLKTIQLLGSLKNKKGDTILGAVTDLLAKEGIELLPSISYLSDHLAQKGALTKRSLSKAEKEDIEFGTEIAKKIAELEIGQTVCVKDKAVVAVESMEGTDECISRASKLANGGVVVVKVSKPKQDLRFDIPVIGTKTITTLKENRVKVMAIEAGKTLLLEKDKLLLEAEQSDISLYGI